MAHLFARVRVAVLVILTLYTPVASAAAALDGASRSVPPVLAGFARFEARITYAGHRTDVSNAPEVQGTALVSASGFVIDERAPQYALHADADGVVIRAGATTARASNPLDADLLVNPWIVAAAGLARGDPVRRGPSAWRTSNGLTVYTDQAGTAIAGLVTGDGSSAVAFTFDGWAAVGGVAFPTRIVRLRHGAVDGTFSIDRLDVLRSVPATSESAAQSEGMAPHALALTTAQPADAQRVAPAFPWRLVLTFFGLMALAVAIVAWTRRDAFADRACRRLADDQRGWRTRSTPAYVSADGLLHHEGNIYRAGLEFYARTVEVQHSALFVRISAPGLSKVLVLPRKLPRPAPAPRRAARRTAAAGMSLIETLFAIAFFAVVVVAAVYPALCAVARADLLAAQRRAAITAVNNALTDEEAACAYGNSSPTGTASTTANGMTITVRVTNSSVAGARDIAVSASDASGHVLARAATTVGPPVPPPGGP